MSTVKAVPKRLKWIECENGVGNENFPICYIPEQNPVQDALKKTKRPPTSSCFFFTPGMSSMWQFGCLRLTSSTACMHCHSCIKADGLDAGFKEAEVALKLVILNLDIATLEYSSKKKEAKEHKEKLIPNSQATSLVVVAKTTYKKAIRAMEAVNLVVAMAGANAFYLFGNHLSNEARQPWEKIIKRQVTCAPWEDVYGVMHSKNPTKTWNS